MAIKTSSQGTLPAITLDYIQYSEFNMRVSENAPYNIGLSAKLKSYGIDGGVKYYAKDSQPMNIPNIDAYIASLPAERQPEAMQALGAVQTGLGILASIYLNVDFVGVE